MIHRLRPAQSSDFERLLALHREGRRVDGPDVDARAEFTRTFATHAIQVVEIDDEPVGMLAVEWEREPIAIATVELWPRWQGRGLGTRLVHDVLLQARARDQAVEVEVPGSSPVRALLDRLGFRTLASTPTVARLRWEASIRTDVTLAAAMSPWADPKRRRAWAQRVFEPGPEAQLEFLRFAAGRHGLPPEARVLDAHAGTGRRLRPLAAAGWRVTGIESDPDLRAAAARVAAAAGPAVSLGAASLAELGDEAAYDLALVLDGGLWTALTHAGRVDVARRLRRAVVPGGLLVVEGPNALVCLHGQREPAARTELYHRAHVSKIPRQRFDFHDGVLDRRDAIVVEVDGEEVAEWTERRREALMGRPMLVQALREAGWGAIEVYADLLATGPGRATGPTIVLVARADGSADATTR